DNSVSVEGEISALGRKCPLTEGLCLPHGFSLEQLSVIAGCCCCCWGRRSSPLQLQLEDIVDSGINRKDAKMEADSAGFSFTASFRSMKEF
ncbi:hypothetical protein ATANTOWER_000362, partial [Ataeniobius toweri]|nr:hypothetical protein [Ataeniobius toweri]